MDTNALLDAVKRRHRLESDYQLARLLGWDTSKLSAYRNGRARIGEATAVQLAGLLDMEPGYVLACLAAERAQSAEVRNAWERAAARLSAALAAILAVWLLGVALPGSDALAASWPVVGGLLIMSNALIVIGPAYLLAIGWAFRVQIAQLANVLLLTLKHPHGRP